MGLSEAPLHPGLSYKALTPTPGVSAAWLATHPDLRRITVEAIILTSSWDGSIEFIDLMGPGDREVVVRMTRPWRPGARGHTLMALEAYIRKELGEPLEVYLGLKADRNRPRVALQARIDEWRRRRAESQQANAEAAVRGKQDDHAG